ncbi:hypothetical protein EPO34_03545 [Patescibacteria group bacterium]|nr:MAG: hypothetical protein EPO34_03545 [Patescibacteria group bacterium]
MASQQELEKFRTEYDEAVKNARYYFHPEYDKAYKLFESYTGDRAEELEQLTSGEVWQSNVFMPYVFGYIKAYLQKTVGVMPDLRVQGTHGEALKEVLELLWEYRMSEDQIDYFLQCLIFGHTIGKDFLKKEAVRTVEKKIGLIEKVKKLFRRQKTAGFVFWPDFDPVDVYNFFRHVRMRKLSDPLPVFQRYVITLDEAKAQYPDVPDSAWARFVDKDGKPLSGMGDTTDFAYVRKEVLLEIRKSIRHTTKASRQFGDANPGVNSEPKSSDVLFEIVERWMDDRMTVFCPGGGVTGALEIKDGANPHDHSEKPFRKVTFFPRPFQFEGMGMPKLLMHMQELVNSDTNKIEDAVTVRINGMIAAAPVALPGYDQRKSIVVRPMGILWTNDPASVREIRFGDVNQGNFVQIDRIKEMMRFVAGIDDYSTLQGSNGKETATVASFMREATLEGVKLFLFMLRNAYIGHFDHFISMIKQHWTRRSVVPKRILAALDDYTDTDFPVLEEGWIGQDGKHALFPDEYELSVEQASTLATSTELRKQKDLELWEKIKDMPDDIADPETGKVFSIKKFKILARIFEDYGWEEDQYIVEKTAPVLPAPLPGSTPPAEGITPPAPTIPLPGQEAGANLGGAVRQ